MIKPINWQRVKVTDNRATNLCLSLLYKYRVVQPRPLKTIYLSGMLYDSLMVYWTRKVGSDQFIPDFDGVDVKRGSMIKWEHEEEFWPEIRTELNDLVYSTKDKTKEQSPLVVNRELEDLYKSGSIKTSIKKENED